ncbi:ATP-binding cassette domain-containing protein [Candidatus Gottesmanbacteria bacterium]|nr:ATP-binding cassette domain-containing protein [Candidatus Gottesmanbacteria bacterium]
MLELKNVNKKFGSDQVALDNVSLQIKDQEFLFVVGPTGSGKTTLIRLLIRDILPDSGKIIVDQDEVTKKNFSQISQLRRKIGVVFQDFKLLWERTVAENVALPLEILGKPAKEIKNKVNDLLKKFNLTQLSNKFPVQLSGGELQRVVIARAMIANPKILLADEPTGNLDPATSWEIVKLLSDINKSGTTVIMATHNVDIVNSLGKRVVRLEHGKIVKDEKEGRYER